MVSRLEDAFEDGFPRFSLTNQDHQWFSGSMLVLKGDSSAQDSQLKGQKHLKTMLGKSLTLWVLRIES